MSLRGRGREHYDARRPLPTDVCRNHGCGITRSEAKRTGAECPNGWQAWPIDYKPGDPPPRKRHDWKRAPAPETE